MKTEGFQRVRGFERCSKAILLVQETSRALSDFVDKKYTKQKRRRCGSFIISYKIF